MVIFGLPAYYVKAWPFFRTDSFRSCEALALGVTQTGISDIGINGVKYEGQKKTGFGRHAELGFVYGGFNLSYVLFNNGGTPGDFKPFPKAQGLSATYQKFSIGYRYSM